MLMDVIALRLRALRGEYDVELALKRTEGVLTPTERTRTAA
jgi:hypothetical protein